MVATSHVYSVEQNRNRSAYTGTKVRVVPDGPHLYGTLREVVSS